MVLWPKENQADQIFLTASLNLWTFLSDDKSLVSNMKIGLVSDSHGYIDDRICELLKDCQEIWHAGDIGDLTVTDRLAEVAPVVAVYGNIDDAPIRRKFPKDQFFERNGLKIWMTHIGGYPPRYKPGIIKNLQVYQPHLFICGHSHILKAVPDPKRNLLHLNPGAIGQSGFHKIRTMMRFEILDGKPSNLEVIELGKRGAEP